ncbi:ADP/ATP translocase [Aphelenchoides bicaudatus]|nr:ADP/ATP translocase [Aphelenchoides bicaudatus]
MPAGSSQTALYANNDLIVKFGKDFSIGGWSAVVAKTLCAPVERIKLILQLQNAQNTIKNPYNGLIDCLLRVPKEQGFLSFWRGNWSNILRASSQVPFNTPRNLFNARLFQESLGLAFKELFRKYIVIDDVEKSSNYAQFVGSNILAGGLAGSATFCIIYPLDFSRTRLAIDMGRSPATREFQGLTDCLLKITKHDGFLGLYRGFLPSLQFIFLYRSAYYGLFDVMKDWTLDNGYAKQQNDLSFFHAFFIGQISAFTAAMISYPMDTVRRRLTMDAGKSMHAYKGTIDCTKKIYLVEGPRAFFNGALVNSIRSIGAALILALYETTAKHF